MLLSNSKFRELIPIKFVKNINKDAVKLGNLRQENLGKSAKFDEIRRENLDERCDRNG